MRSNESVSGIPFLFCFTFLAQDSATADTFVPHVVWVQGLERKRKDEKGIPKALAAVGGNVVPCQRQLAHRLTPHNSWAAQDIVDRCHCLGPWICEFIRPNRRGATARRNDFLAVTLFSLTYLSFWPHTNVQGVCGQRKIRQRKDWPVIIFFFTIIHHSQTNINEWWWGKRK